MLDPSIGSISWLIEVFCSSTAFCVRTASAYVILGFFVPSVKFTLFPTRSSFGSRGLNNVLMCSQPMITLLNFVNNMPCTGLDMKSANKLSVEHYSTDILPFLILSVLQKYLMETCLELDVHDALPLVSILISDTLSFARIVSIL